MRFNNQPIVTGGIPPVVPKEITQKIIKKEQGICHVCGKENCSTLFFKDNNPFNIEEDNLTIIDDLCLTWHQLNLIQDKGTLIYIPQLSIQSFMQLQSSIITHWYAKKTQNKALQSYNFLLNQKKFAKKILGFTSPQQLSELIGIYDTQQLLKLDKKVNNLFLLLNPVYFKHFSE